MKVTEQHRMELVEDFTVFLRVSGHGDWDSLLRWYSGQYPKVRDKNLGCLYFVFNRINRTRQYTGSLSWWNVFDEHYGTSTLMDAHMDTALRWVLARIKTAPALDVLV